MLDSRDPASVVKAFSAGARGVIGSADPLEMLCKCIKSVQMGQVWANSQEAHWILQALTNKEPHRVLAAQKIPSLTSRQAQIVTMVTEGLPNKEIASALGVSEHTVRNHLFRIYERLGVTNRVELIFYALSRGGRPTPTDADGT
jgi:DNA-binding NarL/FixJ family response regulator